MMAGAGRLGWSELVLLVGIWLPPAVFGSPPRSDPPRVGRPFGSGTRSTYVPANRYAVPWRTIPTGRNSRETPIRSHEPCTAPSQSPTGP